MISKGAVSYVKWFIFLFLFIPLVAYPAIPTWQIIPSESSISFTGTQNGAPASGSFKKFTGNIQMDLNQLSDSKVKVIVDINSLSMPYSTFTDTLLTSDWFNVARFPTAVFEATHFTKTGENEYQANGTLTIRDKTEPVTLTFVAMPLSNNKEQVKGSTVLKRTVFGVGQGAWADTSTVKDDVQVSFVITAVKL